MLFGCFTDARRQSQVRNIAVDVDLVSEGAGGDYMASTERIKHHAYL